MFAVWKIKENVEYKLALTTGETMRLEKQFGGNLLNSLMQAGNGQLPSLNWMLAIVHGAMQKFNHGIDFDEVLELYDEYVENEGNQTDLMKVVTEVFKVSGFLPKGKKKEQKKAILA